MTESDIAYKAYLSAERCKYKFSGRSAEIIFGRKGAVDLSITSIIEVDSWRFPVYRNTGDLRTNPAHMRLFLAQSDTESVIDKVIGKKFNLTKLIFAQVLIRMESMRDEAQEG